MQFPLVTYCSIDIHQPNHIQPIVLNKIVRATQRFVMLSTLCRVHISAAIIRYSRNNIADVIYYLHREADGKLTAEPNCENGNQSNELVYTFHHFVYSLELLR